MCKHAENRLVYGVGNRSADDVAVSLSALTDGDSRDTLAYVYNIQLQCTIQYSHHKSCFRFSLGMRYTHEVELKLPVTGLSGQRPCLSSIY